MNFEVKAKRVIDLKSDPKFKDGWAHVENINSVEGILMELNGMLQNDRHERLMAEFDRQQLEYRLKRNMAGYTEWCENSGVTHGHCPDGCEHPQPFALDGILVCGRCYFIYNEIVEMVPCTPEYCG